VRKSKTHADYRRELLVADNADLKAKVTALVKERDASSGRLIDRDREIQRHISSRDQEARRAQRAEFKYEAMERVVRLLSDKLQEFEK
jgi:hypothetical protein